MSNRIFYDWKKKCGISVHKRINSRESSRQSINTSTSNLDPFKNETRTKSLQDLQTEVDALIEFQNIVIETFPDLKTKMMSIRSAALSKRNQLKKKRIRKKSFVSGSAQESSFISPVDVIDEVVPPFFFRNRSYSIGCRKEPKSGEGSGCTVQDSGFSTETVSSKDGYYAPASSTGLEGANASNRLLCDSDDELLNLLDVIFRKTLKFRQIFSSLPHFECEKSATFTSSACISNILSSNCLNPKKLRFNVNYQLKQNILRLNKERDILLLKVAELESEIVKHRLEISNMNTKLKLFTSGGKKLQEQLEIDLNQDKEYNFKLYPPKCDSASRMCVRPKPTVKRQRKTYQEHQCPKFSTGKKGSNNIFQNIPNGAIHVSATKCNLGCIYESSKNDIQSLGKFDGLLSSPKCLCKVREIDSDKIAAILLENNPLELQRHLITLTIEKQSKGLDPEIHGPKSIPPILKQNSSKLLLQRTDNTNTSDYIHDCENNSSLEYFTNFKHLQYENVESIKVDNSMGNICGHDPEIHNEFDKNNQLSKRMKPSKIPLFDSKTFHSTKAIQKSLSLSTGNIYLKKNKLRQHDSPTMKIRGSSTGPKILSVSSVLLEPNQDLEKEKFFHLESPVKPKKCSKSNEYIQSDKKAESITQLIPNTHSNPLITFSFRSDTKEKVNYMLNSTKMQLNKKDMKAKVDTQNNIAYLTQPGVQMLIGGVTKSSYRNLIKNSSNNNSMAEEETFADDHLGRVNNLRSALLGWLKI